MGQGKRQQIQKSYVSSDTSPLYSSVSNSYRLLGVNEYTKAFTELASAGFIKAVLPEHSRSTTDRYLDAREKESQKYTIMTAKDMAAVKAAAQAQVDAEYTLSETLGMVIHSPWLDATDNSLDH